MTREEIIAKAVWVQVPYFGKDYRNTPSGVEVHRLPLTQQLYKEWHANDNHFTTEYHRNNTIPVICSALNVNYNPNDFHIEGRKDKKFDISMLVPNREFRYNVECFELNETKENVDYSFLINGTHGYSGYHNLYQYPHMCSHITNLTLPSGRKLLVSGDSHMIPNVAVLSTYFKELYYLDNRSGRSFYSKFMDVDFTDVLMVCGFREHTVFTKDNLR